MLLLIYRTIWVEVICECPKKIGMIVRHFRPLQLDSKKKRSQVVLRLLGVFFLFSVGYGPVGPAQA